MADGTAETHESGGSEMTVTLIAASGRTVDVRTPVCSTDSAAARFALKEACFLHGSEHGWRVLRVL
jgi:hypothetical protein